MQEPSLLVGQPSPETLLGSTRTGLNQSAGLARRAGQWTASHRRSEKLKQTFMQNWFPQPTIVLIAETQTDHPGTCILCRC